LSYTKNIYDLLQIIENNFKKILELFKKYDSNKEGKNKNYINLDNLGVPNPNDNLEEISKLYINLLKDQYEEVNKRFILFDSSLFEKYIFYHKKKFLKFVLFKKYFFDNKRERE